MSRTLLHDPALLPFALGTDSDGQLRVVDLVRTPHLLVAGSPGTGVPQFVSLLVDGLAVSRRPATVRLVVADLDGWGLGSTLCGGDAQPDPVTGYPHLMQEPLRSAGEAIDSLAGCVEEMDLRYRLLATAGARDLPAYNALAEGDSPELPYKHAIAVVIGEVAKLVDADRRRAEALILRLGQLGRAVGMHLIVATQHPTPSVLGNVRTMLTSRIALQVGLAKESKAVLGHAGAEAIEPDELLALICGCRDIIRCKQPWALRDG